jgi:hypothetical protein
VCATQCRLIPLTVSLSFGRGCPGRWRPARGETRADGAGHAQHRTPSSAISALTDACRTPLVVPNHPGDCARPVGPAEHRPRKVLIRRANVPWLGCGVADLGLAEQGFHGLGLVLSAL